MDNNNTIFTDLMNREEKLELALFAASQIPDPENTTRYTADQYIISYIIEEFVNNGKDNFTEEEVKEEYSKLISSYILRLLADKGMVETEINENGEFEYKLKYDS